MTIISKASRWTGTVCGSCRGGLTYGRWYTWIVHDTRIDWINTKQWVTTKIEQIKGFIHIIFEPSLIRKEAMYALFINDFLHMMHNNTTKSLMGWAPLRNKHDHFRDLTLSQYINNRFHSWTQIYRGTNSIVIEWKIIHLRERERTVNLNSFKLIKCFV